MRKTKLGSRILAWFCVVLMLVMMLPLSGFGETEDTTGETTVTESPAYEAPAPVQAAPAASAASAAKTASSSSTAAAQSAPAEEPAAESESAPAAEPAAESESAPAAETEPAAEEAAGETSDKDTASASGAKSAGSSATRGEFDLTTDGEGEITVSFKLSGTKEDGKKDVTLTPDEDGAFEDYKLELTAADHYSLTGAEVEVKVGGEVLEQNDETYGYEFVQTSGTVTIKAAALTGDVTITVNAKEDPRSDFETILQNVQISGTPEKMYRGTEYTVTLTADPHYTLPDSITITGVEEGYTYTPNEAKTSATLTFTPKANAEKVELRAEGLISEYYYTFSVDGEHFSLTNMNVSVYATDGGSVALKAAEYYDVPSTIKLMLDKEEITGYSYSNGTISFEKDALPVLTDGSKEIKISGEAKETVYTITVNYDHVRQGKYRPVSYSSVTGASLIQETDTGAKFETTRSKEVEIKLSVSKNSSIKPANFSISGVQLNAPEIETTTSYESWDYLGLYPQEETTKATIKSKDGNWTIVFDYYNDNVSAITIHVKNDTIGSNVTIETGPTEKADVSVKIAEGTNTTFGNGTIYDSVKSGNSYSGSLYAQSGYTFTGAITVKVGGTEIEIHVDGKDEVKDENGNVTQEAVAAVDGYTYTLDSNKKTATITIDASLIESSDDEIELAPVTTLDIKGNYSISGTTNSEGWYSKEVKITPKDPATKVSIDGTNFYSEIIIGGKEDGVIGGTRLYLPDGEYSKSIYVTDGVKYSSASAKEKIYVDTTPMDITAASPVGMSRPNAYNDAYYTNNEATVIFTVKETNFNPKSDPAVGSYTITTDPAATCTVGEWTQNGDEWSLPVTLKTENNTDGAYTITLAATDVAGHPGEDTSATIVLDKTLPAVSIVDYSASARKDAYNGKYYVNEEITVTFQVADKNFDPEDAGAYTITTAAAYTEGKWEKNGDTWTLPVTLKATGDNDGEYTLTLDVKDLALNEGNTETAPIVLDKTDPTVSIYPQPLGYKDMSYSITKDENEGVYGGKYYTNNTITVLFRVVDTNFDPQDEGAYVITTGANYTEGNWSQNGNVWTLPVTLKTENNTDGEYTIQLDVKDLALNKGNTETDPIVLDKTPVKISAISYTETPNSEPKLLQIIYKIFGIESSTDGTVTGTVEITDETSPIYIPSIQFTGLPDSAKYTFSNDKGDPISTGSLDSTSKKVVVTFVVTEEYKGQISISATDVPQNEDTSIAITNQNTYGTNLNLDKTTPTVDFGSPDFASVHNSAYSFTFTATDPNGDTTSSGLNSVTYQVYKFSNTSYQTSTAVENGSAVTYSFTDGDYNTEANYTITIPMNTSSYSNLVYVAVTVTDNAGNSEVYYSYESTHGAGVDSSRLFKMDNVPPVINVVYDNNSEQNGKYYQNTRTATITVMDHNFDPNQVTISTGGVSTSWSAGTDSDGDGLPDTYVCTVGYLTDNDYQITVTATDLGGNSTSDANVTYTGTAPQDFTVDLTKPTYEVSFADGDTPVDHEGYSQGPATVTLTVNEHNFDPNTATAGITVLRVYNDGREEDISADIRSLIAWLSNGDTRTASFTLPDDGMYKIKMNFADMAGNNTDDADYRIVYVDNTDPFVEITGILNNSANNDKGDIYPIVTISDMFYDAEHGMDGIKLVNGVGEDVTDKYLDEDCASEVTYDEETDIYTQVFTFKNITEDDIYGIVAVHTDLSGRQNGSMLVHNEMSANGVYDDGDEFKFMEHDLRGERFSVNRNGSAYGLTWESIDPVGRETLVGEYVQGVQGVHLLETNVDELIPESIHIALTHDSQSRDLVNGTDFTYEAPSEDASEKWNWHLYEYVFKDSLFEEDGVYTITVYSEDAAGNISQNNTEEKAFEVMFIVDKTDPIYISMNLEAGEIYNEEEMTVTINVSDNIALDGVSVYQLDSTAAKDEDGNYIWFDEEGRLADGVTALEVTPEGSDGDYTFVLHEGTSAATSKQSVLVVCTDKAGNLNEEQEIRDFTVSSSFWIRYYANKPLFYGSIGGVLVLLGGAAIVFFRKKEEDEEEETAEVR